MKTLARNPQVVQLARDLGLPIGSDCLRVIREFALSRVAQILEDFAVTDLEGLRHIVANKLRVKVEQIVTNDDVERIARDHSDFHPTLRQRLRHEFLDSHTEGICLDRDVYHSKLFRFLVVVDARGDRSGRAYFTVWHELTHLLLNPPQLAFPNFRRCAEHRELSKDPIESVMDHVAGRLAFYPRFYAPVLLAAVESAGGFSFRAFERARAKAARSASLLATAIGSINHCPDPLLLVSVAFGMKASDKRAWAAGQESFEFAPLGQSRSLRVVSVIANDAARDCPWQIRRNMRIPTISVLAKAYRSGGEIDLEAIEDQDWWVTSREGRLRSLRLHIQAVRRGRFVYGLIALGTSSAAHAVQWRGRGATRARNSQVDQDN
jgi:hypothetical protein